MPQRGDGVDVQPTTVVAGVRLTRPDGWVEPQVRPGATMTADLLAVADWLDAPRVDPGAMASSGVDWRPVFTRLADAARSVVLVNHCSREVICPVGQPG